MYNYQATNTWDMISLHDCNATKVSKSDGVLDLHFDDGFWIAKANPQNPFGITVRTGKSLLQFLNPENISLSFFSVETKEEKLFVQKNGPLTLNSLISHLDAD